MGSNHIWFAIIDKGFSLKYDENYYSQEFLKECKYIHKKKKNVIRHITDHLEFYSDDSSKE